MHFFTLELLNEQNQSLDLQATKNLVFTFRFYNHVSMKKKSTFVLPRPIWIQLLHKIKKREKSRLSFLRLICLNLIYELLFVQSWEEVTHSWIRFDSHHHFLATRIKCPATERFCLPKSSGNGALLGQGRTFIRPFLDRGRNFTPHWLLLPSVSKLLFFVWILCKYVVPVSMSMSLICAFWRVIVMIPWISWILLWI